MRADRHLHNPLWDYAAEVYEHDGVATACLALQDRFGVDVNLLLYAAWLAKLRRRLTAAHLQALEAAIADWREEVVRPLRALRRQIRTTPGAGDVYDGLKALEMRAERVQLDAMHAFHLQAGALPATLDGLRDNLQVVTDSVAASHADLEAALDALVARLQV